MFPHLVRRMVVYAVAVLLPICLVVSTVDAHRVIRDIEYAVVDGISLRLDLYLPEASQAASVPLVVWVHGGGWRAGSKDRTYAPETLGEAYAVASIDYRLSQVATFPAQIHDVKAAIRWLRAHAKVYGFDPDHVGAWGSSAGGHLVALLGTSCGVEALEGSVGGFSEQSSCVHAVCDFYGPADLPALIEQRGGTDPWHLMPEEQLIGGPVADNLELAILASPIAHVDSDDPPFLIMHGSEDQTVFVEQSIAFDAALQAAGADSMLIVIDGAGHGFPRSHLARVKPFFDEHLLGAIATEAEDGSRAVEAVHRYGQTFLTWHEIDAERFVVYRSAVPLRGLEDVVGLEPIAVLPSGSAVNARASEVEGTRVRYAIQDGAPVPDGVGLCVVTATTDDTAFYGVAATDPMGQAASWIGGTDAVAETVDVPRPVLQTREVESEYVRMRFAHWAPHEDTACAKALCNRPGQTFNFVVREPLAATTPTAALFVLHGGGGSYGNAAIFPQHRGLLIVSPESIIPGRPDGVDRTWDAWYGYNENVGTGRPLDEGVNVDYTVRRLRWMVEWILEAFSTVDVNRVFLRGSSMGGVGAVFSAIMLRDVFAGGVAIVPRFDYGAADVAHESLATFAVRWGTPRENLPSTDGIGVYDRLDAGYLASSHPEWDFAPVFAFNGRNDTAVGWSEKIPFYDAMEATRHGWAFYWDLRGHGQAPHPRAWRESGWEEDVFDWMIETIRLDQSYPAFSHCSLDDDPGDGDPEDGDGVGTINGFLLWDPGTIEDTERQWSAVLRLRSEAPAASCTVDVTPRRLQELQVEPGCLFDYRVRRESTGATVASGTMRADADGLLVIPAVPVETAGTRLVVRPKPSA